MTTYQENQDELLERLKEIKDKQNTIDIKIDDIKLKVEKQNE